MQDVSDLGLLISGMFAGAAGVFSMLIWCALPLFFLVTFCKVWRACNRIAKISDNIERFTQAVIADKHITEREYSNNRQRNAQPSRKYY